MEKLPVPKILLLLLAVQLPALALPPADASSCSAVPDLGATRLRWSQGRSAETRNLDQACRTYRMQLYEAVAARQTTSTCKVGAEREKEMTLLDSEIEAFNDLIAAKCDT
jgi:hypothetical protein